MTATAQAGEIVRLRAADGHIFDAYLAEPAGKPRGGIVILMEIFGLTPHLRGVCDAFASDGYRVIAPAIFDRVESGAVIPYTPDGLQRALAIKAKHGDWDKMLLDTEAAKTLVAPDKTMGAGKVACIGYCFGGSIAWIAAARSGFDAVVAYYGSEMMGFLDIRPTCPVICHIGTADHHLTPDKVARIAAAYPDMPLYLYEGAEHGFNCDGMAQRYDAAAAKLARERTLAFLHKHIG